MLLAGYVSVYIVLDAFLAPRQDLRQEPLAGHIWYIISVVIFGLSTFLALNYLKLSLLLRRLLSAMLTVIFGFLVLTRLFPEMAGINLGSGYGLPVIMDIVAGIIIALMVVMSPYSSLTVASKSNE